MPLRGGFFLRVAESLPCAAWRATRLRRSQQGQAAVIFIVLLGLILLLAASTMNLGEVAHLRTATANAADAGALAGASWVASGDNETAFIARGMWLNQLLVQLLFLLPFCWQACRLAVQSYITLIINNQLLKVAANEVLHNAWDTAHATALFTAIQNTVIDDQSGQVSAQIRALSDGFRSSHSVPDTVTLNWVRKGAGGAEEPSSVTISLGFPGGQPSLAMGGWGPFFICWSPPIPPYCIWTAFGWGGGTVDTGPFGGNAEVGGPVKAPSWIGYGKLIIWAWPGTCLACFPIPFSLFGLVIPSDIDNGRGEVTVTVAQHRAGGTSLAFWTTRYPELITSSATAHYGGASVGLWPRPDAKAELVAVR